MIRDPLQSAIRAGIPFVINMAYGKSSEVRESWKIAVGRARVVVLEARSARVPPMLTMTGISYLPKKTAKSKAPRMTRITPKDFSSRFRVNSRLPRRSCSEGGLLNLKNLAPKAFGD